MWVFDDDELWADSAPQAVRDWLEDYEDADLKRYRASDSRIIENTKENEYYMMKCMVKLVELAEEHNIQALRDFIHRNLVHERRLPLQYHEPGENAYVDQFLAMRDRADAREEGTKKVG